MPAFRDTIATGVQHLEQSHLLLTQAVTSVAKLIILQSEITWRGAGSVSLAREPARPRMLAWGGGGGGGGGGAGSLASSTVSTSARSPP